MSCKAAILISILVLVPSVVALAQTPLGTAFTYQGQLQSNGSPANGSFNMVFKLWNDASLSAPANQVGPTLTFDGAGGNPPPVIVANGLFTQQLDFGAGAFDGNKRWLEITVGGTTLSPRTELTATPYALYSGGGSGGGPWTTSGTNISNTNTGNVGIGTSTPNRRLTVQTASDAYGLAHTNGNIEIASYISSTDAFFGTKSSHDLYLMTNGGAKMIITATGRIGLGDIAPTNPLTVGGPANFESNVGIGTSSPSTSLTIAGTNNFGTGGSSLYLTNTTAITGRTYLVGSTTGGLFQIGDVTAGLATRVVVDAAGNVGIGTVSPGQKLQVSGNICATGTIAACSDARFKKNVMGLTNALGMVTQLRGITFDWKRKEFADHQFDEGQQIGFIAQDVQQILPQVVSTGSDGYLSVDYGRLTPALVEAVKQLKREQDAELKSLKAENAELKRQGAELKARLDRLESSLASSALR